MSRWLAEAAAHGEIRLLHNHSLWMMPNVYPGRVAKDFGLPLVVSPRGTLSAWAMASGSPVKRLFWPLVQAPALGATRCFHATAESEYEDIRRMGFRQPVAVVPNGIDIPAPSLAPSLEAAQQRTLLFLGRIHPVKGLDWLLPAWGAVQERFPDWRLQIAGPDNGGYLRQMQDLASGLKLRRVEFSGPVYGAAKWRLYQGAELFVLPTHSENFGLSAAEALASGTPAIVTRGAPWQGLNTHGAGWWIDPGLDALVACLESALARHPGELESMGQAGRAWMEAEYSWRQVGQRMARTYRWLSQGGEPPAWLRMN